MPDAPLQERDLTPQRGSADNENSRSLRSYPAPWTGQILLACGKCRRKLRRRAGDKAVLKLKKILKRLARRDDDGLRLRVVEVSCLKMCPRGGVTVCTQAQLGVGECSILRDRADVEALYVRARAESLNSS
ncbi:MAG TPA: hypothetical protein VGD59_13205 [Acidisarcina sp.]